MCFGFVRQYCSIIEVIVFVVCCSFVLHRINQIVILAESES